MIQPLASVQSVQALDDRVRPARSGFVEIKLQSSTFLILPTLSIFHRDRLTLITNEEPQRLQRFHRFDGEECGRTDSGKARVASVSRTKRFFRVRTKKPASGWTRVIDTQGFSVDEVLLIVIEESCGPSANAMYGHRNGLRLLAECFTDDDVRAVLAKRYLAFEKEGDQCVVRRRQS